MSVRWSPINIILNSFIPSVCYRWRGLAMNCWFSLIMKVVITLHLLSISLSICILLLRLTKMESLFNHFLRLPDMSSNKDPIIHIFSNAGIYSRIFFLLIIKLKASLQLNSPLFSFELTCFKGPSSLLFRVGGQHVQSGIIL